MATPFSVFTPFYRAWDQLPVPGPADGHPQWRADLDSDPIPTGDPGVGEAAALERLDQFVSGPVAEYDRDRNRTDLAGTAG